MEQAILIEKKSLGKYGSSQIHEELLTLLKVSLSAQHLLNSGTDVFHSENVSMQNVNFLRPFFLSDSKANKPDTNERENCLPRGNATRALLASLRVARFLARGFCARSRGSLALLIPKKSNGTSRSVGIVLHDLISPLSTLTRLSQHFTEPHFFSPIF